MSGRWHGCSANGARPQPEKTAFAARTRRCCGRTGWGSPVVRDARESARPRRDPPTGPRPPRRTGRQLRLRPHRPRDRGGGRLGVRFHLPASTPNVCSYRGWWLAPRLRVRLAGTRFRTRRGPGPDLAAARPPVTGPEPWATKIRGTVTRDGDDWVAYLRLEDPSGVSPITTVGRFDTVEAAQVATDEVWAAR
jgi:hypothetical protein